MCRRCKFSPSFLCNNFLHKNKMMPEEPFVGCLIHERIKEICLLLNAGRELRNFKMSFFTSLKMYVTTQRKEKGQE